ncbi:ABC transporter ATP-binding protein [Dyadobacter sp. 50-39]|uniref:ABC transporter ATP-binding protein n=1 Tax=Dyadobacter sp. 50-39 TaxID=1895756 RepID=UPI00286E2493|nr:ABC transporter ATP-binding protein [Dyadobacter sp. 50-39]
MVVGKYAHHARGNAGVQQQRVAIARALINDPSIAMGDEPTGNLDSAHTATVFALFKELAKERQQTVLVVTHDGDFARRADRRIYIADGQIVGPVAKFPIHLK